MGKEIRWPAASWSCVALLGRRSWKLVIHLDVYCVYHSDHPATASGWLHGQSTGSTSTTVVPARPIGKNGHHPHPALSALAAINELDHFPLSVYYATQCLFALAPRSKEAMLGTSR